MIFRYMGRYLILPNIGFFDNKIYKFSLTAKNHYFFVILLQCEAKVSMRTSKRRYTGKFKCIVRMRTCAAHVQTLSIFTVYIRFDVRLHT